MNAQNLAFAAEPNTEDSNLEMPKEEYIDWLESVSERATALQLECSNMLTVTGLGGSRGPWLSVVNDTLNTLVDSSLTDAIEAATEEA